jgi:hypothetical protein
MRIGRKIVAGIAVIIAGIVVKKIMKKRRRDRPDQWVGCCSFPYSKVLKNTKSVVRTITASVTRMKIIKLYVTFGHNELQKPGVRRIVWIDTVPSQSTL